MGGIKGKPPKQTETLTPCNDPTQIQYHAILDLSFELMVAGYLLLSTNNATRKCAPEEAMDQIGLVLLLIIKA